MAKLNRKVTLPATPGMSNSAPANAPKEPIMATDAAPATADLDLADPRLPAGIAAGSSPAPADDDNGPDEADLPADKKSNKVAVDKGVYFDQARKLGDTKIKGDNSLFSLAELALNGGKAGALVVAKENSDNDAYKLYERFYNPNTGLKKAKWAERVVNGDSIASNVKKIEWFIKIGRVFGDDGYKFFHRTHDVYRDMMQDEATRKSMKYTAAYEAVLSVLRPFMMDVEKAMTGNKPIPTAADMPDNDKVRSDLLKKEKDAKDALALLAEAYKILDKANEGKSADGKLRKQDLVGLKDDRINGPGGILEMIIDIAKDQGPDAEKQFLDATAPPKVAAPKGRKPKGPKGNAPAATDEEEAQQDADNDAAAEQVEPNEETV